MSALTAVRTWARMVKLSHSVFALPFALAGAALAVPRYGLHARDVLWIVVAMVGARNAAMGFNRLADQEYDARNPRTAGRELPGGRLTRPATWAMTIGLAALFVFAAFRLRPICGWLSLPALGIIFGYSYTKRFTWASHAILGLALALAPLGSWLALAGEFSLIPLVLGLAVLCWVAGFDVIYGCQDVEFDRAEGLHSIPARFGVVRALRAARALHAAAWLALGGVGWLAGLPHVYWVGLAAIAILLVWEHRLVRADDLSKLGVAFFNMNGAVAVMYLVVVALSVGLQTPVVR